MARILFSYEFGAGYGHINRLMELAKRLSAKHETLFAVPDLELCRRALKGGFDTLPAVVQGLSWTPLPRPDLRSVPTYSFADAVALVGYQEPEKLFGACLRSMSLLLQFKPDLIIADWAPTLRLVSKGRIPMVIVGNGYSVPPAGKLLPPIRPWAATVPASSRVNEARLLAAINRANEEFGAPATDFFSDALQGDHTFVCTLTEFDPYRTSRNQKTTWPFNVPAGLSDTVRDAQNDVFCYLHAAHPALKEVLGALKQSNLRSEIFVRGADPRVIASQSRDTATIHTTPADLRYVLPRTRVILHHGGLGTAYAGLAAAIPQLVIPDQLEQQVTSVGLESFGSSTRLPARPRQEDIASALNELVTDQKFATAARKARDDLESRRPDDPVSPILDVCERFL